MDVSDEVFGEREGMGCSVAAGGTLALFSWAGAAACFMAGLWPIGVVCLLASLYGLHIATNVKTHWLDRAGRKLVIEKGHWPFPRAKFFEYGEVEGVYVGRCGREFAVLLVVPSYRYSPLFLDVSETPGEAIGIARRWAQEMRLEVRATPGYQEFCEDMERTQRLLPPGPAALELKEF